MYKLSFLENQALFEPSISQAFLTVSEAARMACVQPKSVQAIFMTLH